MFVANTAMDWIVRIPVNNNGTPGTPEVFTNSINGADGLVLDSDDNLWVAANQADEIVVVDPTGKAIAKLGDFDGVQNGVTRGLLFPASPAFSKDGHWLFVTNLELDLRTLGTWPANRRLAVGSAGRAAQHRQTEGAHSAYRVALQPHGCPGGFLSRHC